VVPSGSAIVAVEPAVKPEPPPVVKPAVPAPLTMDMAVPYFAGRPGPAGEAAAAIALDKWADATPLLDAALAALPAGPSPDRAHLIVLKAVAQEQTKQWAAAAATYAQAAPLVPLLQDYVAYHRARSLYFAHDPEAIVVARTVASDSVHGADAELLVGDVLRTSQDIAAITDHYRNYLSKRPRGVRRSEAKFRLAEAIDSLLAKSAPNPVLQAEMAASYRSIDIEDPLSSWAPKALARLAQLKATMAPDIAAAIGNYTVDEQLTKAKQLFDGMRNPESEAAYDVALSMPAATAAQKCTAAYNRAQSKFKARDRKSAKTMFDASATLCHDAGDKDLEIKSYYQAGHSYSYEKERETAIARYQSAQNIDPSHSYNDDAMLREAEEWASLGNDKKVREVLGALPDKFPKGDVRAEAMWRLGFRSWRAKKYDEAISFWKKQIEVMPIDDNYYAEGQAQYWLGRAYLAKGDSKAALASWRDTVMTYPAAYYAMQALNRIREVAPKDYEAIVIEISTDPAGFDSKAPAFTFSPRVEWGSPGFLRAMELVRLGLGDTASLELGKIGLAAPKGKNRVIDSDQIEKLWAMAFLFDRAGDYGTSLWPTRWHILDYRRAWPVGSNRARWNIAYPKGFWALLSEHAKINEVPVAMQIAIVREESGFDPLLESYANAVGLTQMIFPTAKRFAQGTGIDVSRETLRDPEKNVTIGSRFLGFLFKQWDNYTLLVPPSYNAGEGGVKRMLKVRGTWDADEFIEGIIDDQARNYSKRVLGTFFTYSWLYEQTVPVIPLLIPATALAK
jgi:soluble lytic murein transglycosylase